MEELINVVDWSRAQFALTAIYHWLFVPLTLGLGIIVAVMETIYLKTKSEKWLATTKFWMTIFGVNFAIGVATGIILEFEFGTNWSNYSWFVGDIFGAPLAVEGILAFFMESTFIAVMFFGWKKVSPKFHLAATWLTAIGASLSALWILVANAWMQYPTGCEFNPATMRNEMTSFAAVALSPMAMSKFFHTVLSAWTLGGVFVCGVCGWMMLRKRNIDHCWRSLKVGAWVGVIGIVLTMITGDSSAITVAKYQPMKLAAMEGLYKGNQGQSIVAFGILNPSKQAFDEQDPYLFDISIPKGLSFLATHDFDAFVPGIEDIINGVSYDSEGNAVNTIPYAERMERGKQLQEMLSQYSAAMGSGNALLQDSLKSAINADFKHFGYGYLDAPEEAIPNLQALRLRLPRRTRGGHPQRAADVLHLPLHGDRGRLSAGVPAAGIAVCLQAADSEQGQVVQVVAPSGYRYDTADLPVQRQRMDCRRGGPPAVDHPGPDAQQGGHQRPECRLRAGDLLDFCRGVHGPADCRHRHHLQADFQEVADRLRHS